jgi:hypothetical protein
MLAQGYGCTLELLAACGSSAMRKSLSIQLGRNAEVTASMHLMKQHTVK